MARQGTPWHLHIVLCPFHLKTMCIVLCARMRNNAASVKGKPDGSELAKVPSTYRLPRHSFSDGGPPAKNENDSPISSVLSVLFAAPCAFAPCVFAFPAKQPEPRVQFDQIRLHFFSWNQNSVRAGRVRHKWEGERPREPIRKPPSF